MTKTIILKCKKCRAILTDSKSSESFVNAHNIKLTPSVDESEGCDSIKNNYEYYFENDVNLPNWIKEIIVSGQWTKGKLNCFNCNCRVGSFDFVSGLKCNCHEYDLPSVHLIKSKVDLSVK